MAGHGMRLSKFASPIHPTPFGNVIASIDIVEHDAGDTRWMNGFNLYVPTVNMLQRPSLDCDWNGTDVGVITITGSTRIFEPFMMQMQIDCSTLSSMPALEEMTAFAREEFQTVWQDIAESHLMTGAFNKNGLNAGNEGFSHVATDVSVSGGTDTQDLIAFAEFQIAQYFGNAECAIFIPTDEHAKVTHAAGMPFIDGRWHTPTGNHVIPFTTSSGEAQGPANKVWIAELPVTLHLSPMNIMVPETWIELQKNKFHINVERVGLFEYRNVLSFDIHRTSWGSIL